MVIFTGPKKFEATLRCSDPEKEKEEKDALTNKIDFPEFLTMYENNYKEPETEEGIIAAFREFDKKGNGLISTKKLKKIMTGMGESLSSEEVDEMVKPRPAGATHRIHVNHC